MSKRSALQAKRTELERKIKDLGSLPSEAFEKYTDYQLQDLHKLLQKSNTQLKKFRWESAVGCCMPVPHAQHTAFVSRACISADMGV